MESNYDFFARGWEVRAYGQEINRELDLILADMAEDEAAGTLTRVGEFIMRRDRVMIRFNEYKRKLIAWDAEYAERFGEEPSVIE